MSQEIEIEFKNLLEENEYEQLAQTLPFQKEQRFSQTNYYFETNSFDLREKKCALRIRKKNDTWTATLKEPHPKGLLETHDTLTEEEAQGWMNNEPAPAPNIKDRLANFGIDFSSLQFKGALTTERMETEYMDTLIVLDRSHYNNVTDYEFELEAKEKQHGQTVFKDILHQFDIPERETPNKIKRFFQSVT
ncbi:CYTH domain-containing protein [Pontibacillus yanchengensis]|uniref:CYTH domain-containing protein n=2 Tax=Pontibacillus yanchengensis TaxID=462910 RepID=A0ACC7VBP9_9BACI|nr:CYTH domain-containing protein [Pontibacillus yanchengensis]MYL32218.1 CYTH domain-containing protein [Pontibacillus yanchengensis]MYL52798.1 CYTH domain-containing protein [Pontibacillus yanchengensis]